uniref:Secreted protein n=1 Tax=Aegilops tauschii subsp. strangulata TaxID=200361 RepID=A0A453EVQ8_AEGTS
MKYWLCMLILTDGILCFIASCTNISTPNVSVGRIVFTNFFRPTILVRFFRWFFVPTPPHASTPKKTTRTNTDPIDPLEDMQPPSCDLPHTDARDRRRRPHREDAAESCTRTRSPDP